MHWSWAVVPIATVTDAGSVGVNVTRKIVEAEHMDMHTKVYHNPKRLAF